MSIAQLHAYKAGAAPPSGQHIGSSLSPESKIGSDTDTTKLLMCSPILSPAEGPAFIRLLGCTRCATEETIGSATFLKLEGGNEFPHEGGVADRLFAWDCYKVFAKQVTDYCEQLVDTIMQMGSRKSQLMPHSSFQGVLRVSSLFSAQAQSLK